MLSSSCSICGYNCSISNSTCPECGHSFKQTAQGRSSISTANFSTFSSAGDKSTNIGALAVVCFLLLGIGAILYLFLWGGGNSLSSQADAAARDALKALRKVDAATQVGVSYTNYGSLVIEAQAEVNEALAVLPDGELKTEINSAMLSYAAANAIWSDSIRNGEMVDYVREKTLPNLWKIARKHIDRASKLLNQ